MSLLSMIQSACAQQGLAQPSLVVGSSSDKTAKQMLALAQVEGRELADSYTWSQLQRAFTWTLNAVSLTGTLTNGSAAITGLSSTSTLEVGFAPVVSGFTSFARIISIDSSTQVTVSEDATESATATVVFAQEAYPFPADFARFINRTQWDNTFRWELIGPISPQEWQWRKSGIIASSPRRRFRIAGTGSNQILIDPLPGATDSGQSLVFEYYTDNFSLPVQWVTGTSYHYSCCFRLRLARRASAWWARRQSDHAMTWAGGMRRCASLTAMRRISWIDQRIRSEILPADV